MHGLVSLLPDPYYSKVSEVWEELDNRFGLKGVQVTPLPHFSWQIGENYNFDKLEEAMKGITSRTKPFTVRTTGLGIFSGDEPVIFIQIVKTVELITLHGEIWEECGQFCEGISQYYSPQNWMPHISLVYKDVDTENIPEAMEWLAFQSYDWEMVVDNLSFIYEPEGEFSSLKYSFPFIG